MDLSSEDLENPENFESLEDLFKKVLKDAFNLDVEHISVTMLTPKDYVKKLEESIFELLSSNDEEEIIRFLDYGLAKMDESEKEKELLSLVELTETLTYDSPAQKIILRKLAEIKSQNLLMK